MQDIDNYLVYLKEQYFRKRVPLELQQKIELDCYENPDLTVRERCERFGIKKSRMHEVLILCGMSYIKKTFVDVRVDEELCKQFEVSLQEIIDVDLKCEHQGEIITVVYLDESGIELVPVKSHGWGKSGNPLIAKSRYEPKKRVNILGATVYQYQNGKLISDKRNNFIALGHCDKPINAPTFEHWYSNFLLPKIPANSIIVMDNARFHKRPVTIELTENAGHRILWLPPYAPFLNKIEKKWAQIKFLFRNTKCTIFEAILEFMTPEERSMFTIDGTKIERIEYPEKL